MAKRIPKPFVTRIQAEGTPSEKRGELSELQKKAAELARKYPFDPASRQVYVRDLLAKSLRGELDSEAFKLFAKMTGCWDEIDLCAPRLMRLYGNVRERR